MTKEAVIAFSGENIEWIPEVENLGYKIYLYDTGIQRSKHSKSSIVKEKIKKFSQDQRQQNHFHHNFHNHYEKNLFDRVENFLENKKYLSEIRDILNFVLTSEDTPPKLDKQIEQSQRAIKIKNCPNLKESSVWIHHIIKNYDTLSDKCLFLQGWPFDHCQNLVETILKIESDNIQSLPLSSKRRVDFGTELDQLSLELYKILDKPLENCLWAAGAQFICNSEIIRKYPIEYYQKILDWGKDKPRAAEVTERLWIDILNYGE